MKPKFVSYACLIFKSISTCVACNVSDAAIIRQLNFPKTVEIQLDNIISQNDKVPRELIESLKNQGILEYKTLLGQYQILPESYDANIISPRMDLNYDFHGVRIKLLTANLVRVDRLKRNDIKVTIEYDFLAYYRNTSKLTVRDILNRFKLPSIRSAVINPVDCSVRFIHN